MLLNNVLTNLIHYKKQFMDTTNSQTNFETTKFQTIINKMIDNKSIFGIVLSIEKVNESWTG